jgi:hypothetical protein
MRSHTCTTNQAAGRIKQQGRRYRTALAARYALRVWRSCRHASCSREGASTCSGVWQRTLYMYMRHRCASPPLPLMARRRRQPAIVLLVRLSSRLESFMCPNRTLQSRPLHTL